jgi:MoaA/NifB/PqqE/SkfB family radical SAM enzyme
MQRRLHATHCGGASEEHPMTNTLAKLYIEVTTACNLDCIMCVRRVWDEPLGTMPLATFADLMDQIGDLPAPPTIHLSGFGEPMAHPHFLELVRLAKATGAKVEMTTNGTLLDAAKTQALIDLDLDRLVVSVDGVSPAHYAEIRERGSLGDVIGNLRRLKHLRIQQRGRHGNPQLALAFVAMRENVDDLPKLPALATQLGAWEILVSNVVPHTPEMEAEILYRRSLKACAYRASRWAPALRLPKLDLADNTVGPLQGTFNSTASISLLDASLSGRNDYCRFANEGYAAIRWDGEVSPCLSLLHSHPEYIHGRRKELARHTFGNIHTTPLAEIWHGKYFTDFRRRLVEFNFSPCSTCGGCERFPQNFTDCSGNIFPTCGACLWAQGFIQCA